MEIKIYSFPEMLMKFKSSTKNIQNESQQKLFEKNTSLRTMNVDEMQTFLLIEST